MDKTTHGFILPMEEIYPFYWYAITLAPCDAHQMFDKTQNRSIAFRLYVVHYLFKEICTLSSTLRCSIELSSRGRLHLHGVIMFCSNHAISDFFEHRIHSLLQRYEICMKKIVDNDWLNVYCKKQQRFKTDVYDPEVCSSKIPIINHLDKSQDIDVVMSTDLVFPYYPDDANYIKPEIKTKLIKPLTEHAKKKADQKIKRQCAFDIPYGS